MRTPRQIAFFTQGGLNWIAGIIYNHNLVRAIYCLPPQRQPRLHAILGLSHDQGFQKELGSLKPPVHYYCYKEDYSRADKFKHIRQSFLQGRWPRSLEDLARQLNPVVIFPVQCSLGKDFPAPWIGWIPDFQHQHMPHFFTPEEMGDRDRTYRRLIEDCGHLIVSSQNAYRDLMCWFPTAESKVSVLPFVSMLDPQWLAEDPQPAAAQLKLPSKFLIFPSQFWVHKNHITVFKALRLLKDQGLDIPLVCTGFMQDYRRLEHAPMLLDFIKTAGLEDQVYLLGLLPRRQQVHLMRCAAAIVQSSLFEGWSALVEDSRALGKTIFLSDIPIHREQDPANAFFFEPENFAQLADLIVGHWKNLSPGPDMPRQQQAALEQEDRAIAFAENFLSITSAP